MIHPIRIDANHRYWTPSLIKETRRHGFSEICEAMGVTRPNPHHTEEGRTAGVALHKWFVFLASGNAPKTRPDERIAGRVDGIRQFLADSPFNLTGGEEPRYDPVHNVACTPDAWGSRGAWSWVIDAKGGAKAKYHLLQTACQKLALQENEFKAQKRGALYLRDGSYRLIEHEDRNDITRWQAIAAGFHAMNPDDRKVFAAAERAIDLPSTERVILNAFAARSHYL